MKGYFIYKNRIVQQHDDIKAAIEQLFLNDTPARVLEIGTSYGGLTLLLRDTLNELGMNYVPLRTYDIMLKFEEGSLDDIDNLDFRLHNIFESDSTGLKYKLTCEEAKSFIQSPGKTIVFVDGGCKKAEFNCLSEYIKTGDVILAHDYCENVEVFKSEIENKIWNWCEITEADIQDSCSQFQLNPHLQDKMKNVVWACKIKQ